MSKKVNMTTDGATVRTQGQDLIVAPKRLTMFLAAILLGGFGGMLLLLGLSGVVKSLTEGDWEHILELLGLIIVGVGLLSVAYFAFNKGKNQQAIHFDATNQHVKIGKEVFPFASVTDVYLCHMGNMSLGDISGAMIQTGIVANGKPMPIASLSKAKQADNMSDAVTLIRLYAEHLGHDPKVLGRYEDLIKTELHPKLPVILPFDSKNSV